jgi:hypothetical protein
MSRRQSIQRSVPVQLRESGVFSSFNNTKGFFVRLRCTYDVSLLSDKECIVFDVDNNRQWLFEIDNVSQYLDIIHMIEHFDYTRTDTTLSDELKKLHSFTYSNV